MNSNYGPLVWYPSGTEKPFREPEKQTNIEVEKEKLSQSETLQPYQYQSVNYNSQPLTIYSQPSQQPTIYSQPLPQPTIYSQPSQQPTQPSNLTNFDFQVVPNLESDSSPKIVHHHHYYYPPTSHITETKTNANANANANANVNANENTNNDLWWKIGLTGGLGIVTLITIIMLSLIFVKVSNLKSK